MRVYFVIVVASILVACSTKMFAPTEQTLPNMQQKVPGITLERARKGYQLYTEKCASCHRLYEPGKYTMSQWDGTLIQMFPKAKITDNQQQILIQDYLHALSK